MTEWHFNLILSKNIEPFLLNPPREIILSFKYDAFQNFFTIIRRIPNHSNKVVGTLK